MIGVLAAIENIFPPVPADSVVALGAFLAGRGTLNAWAVLGVTWVFNVGGAACVYALARRQGRAFFQTRTGRKLLSPRALARLEQAYDRRSRRTVPLPRATPATAG